MSLENAIADLLEQRKQELAESDYPGSGSNKESEPSPQGSSQKASFEIVKKGTGGDKGANRLAPGVAAKEDKPMPQGSSNVPGWEDLDSVEVGKRAAAKATETDHKPLGKGPGKAPNFKTVADPTSEVNKSSSAGNKGEPGRKAFESVAALFADDATLTDEFKAKAAGLFEALVAAAVAEQRQALEEEVAETAVNHILATEQAYAEQVDKYLDFIAEQWITKNEVAVDSALQVEMAQSFFAGLRTLYAEHFVTLPEEGTNVVDELQSEIADLKNQLNATIEAGVEVEEEVIKLSRDKALTEASVGLALTEAEKLETLCADVGFEDEASFKGKVAVIRESYFSKTKSSVIAEDKGTEVEDVTGELSETISDPSMDKYLDAISRASKF